MRKGRIIQNIRGKVLDIQGGVDAENRNVIVWKRHGKINQQFDIVYGN
jgi:hypothetical protein